MPMAESMYNIYVSPALENEVIPMINTQEVVLKGALTETLVNKLRQVLHAQLVCYLEGIPPYKCPMVEYIA
jgi:hypothetical protein